MTESRGIFYPRTALQGKQLCAAEQNLESVQLCGGSWGGKAALCREEKKPRGQGGQQVCGKGIGSGARLFLIYL